jgi:hypothetical protein
LGLWEWRSPNFELLGMLHKFTKGRLVLSEAAARHQDDEANVGLVLEEFLDKVVGVKFSITAHRLHVRAEFPLFAFKIGIGRLGHESIVHALEVALDEFSGSDVAPKCTLGTFIPGILRAYNGHVTVVNGGHSGSLAVTRGHSSSRQVDPKCAASGNACPLALWERGWPYASFVCHSRGGGHNRCGRS